MGPRAARADVLIGEGDQALTQRIGIPEDDTGPEIEVAAAERGVELVDVVYGGAETARVVLHVRRGEQLRHAPNAGTRHAFLQGVATTGKQLPARIVARPGDVRARARPGSADAKARTTSSFPDRSFEHRVDRASVRGRLLAVFFQFADDGDNVGISAFGSDRERGGRIAVRVDTDTGVGSVRHEYAD